MNQWKDRLGIIASVVCAVHCAATPILLAFLPALAFTEWMASPRFHQVAAIVCVAMVSLAIWPAFRKYRDYRVLSLSTSGLVLLIAAAFFLPNECCTHTAATALTSTVSPNDPHAGHNHTIGESHDHSGHTHVSSDESTARHTHTALASVFPPELLTLIQPWMTPLGGVLLVIAHGLNLRRRVCTNRRCDCHGESQKTTSLLLVNSKAA